MRSTSLLRSEATEPEDPYPRRCKVVSGHRYYDPEIGRYLTRDPIGYGDGMNVYVYAGNNPINHIDPLGLSWWSDTLSVAKAAAQGARGGLSIVANTFTFGLSDKAGLTNSKQYQGKAYAASRGFAKVSRDAALTAAGVGVLSKVAKTARVANFVVQHATTISKIQKVGAVAMSANAGWNAGQAANAFAEGDYEEGIHRTGRAGMSALFAGSMAQGAGQLAQVGKAVDAAKAELAQAATSGRGPVATGVYNTETGLSAGGSTGGLGSAAQASPSVRANFPEAAPVAGRGPWHCAEPAAASKVGPFTTPRSLIFRSYFVNNGRVAGACLNCEGTFDGATFLGRAATPGAVSATGRSAAGLGLMTPAEKDEEQ